MVVSWEYNGIEWGHMGYLPSGVISSTAIAGTSSNGADDTGGSPSKILGASREGYHQIYGF